MAGLSDGSRRAREIGEARRLTSERYRATVRFTRRGRPGVNPFSAYGTTNGEGMHDNASLSGTAACCVGFHVHQEIATGIPGLKMSDMQDAVCGVRRTTLPRGWVNSVGRCPRLRYAVRGHGRTGGRRPPSRRARRVAGFRRPYRPAARRRTGRCSRTRRLAPRAPESVRRTARPSSAGC
jgi:hypothetical protein